MCGEMFAAFQIHLSNRNRKHFVVESILCKHVNYLLYLFTYSRLCLKNRTEPLAYLCFVSAFGIGIECGTVNYHGDDLDAMIFWSHYSFVESKYRGRRLGNGLNQHTSISYCLFCHIFFEHSRKLPNSNSKHKSFDKECGIRRQFERTEFENL